MRGAEQAISSIIMTGIIGLTIGGILFGTWLLSIIEIAKSEFNDPNGKILWLLIVLLTGPIGIILYITIGKSQRTTTGQQKRQNDNGMTWEPPRADRKGKFDIN